MGQHPTVVGKWDDVDARGWTAAHSGWWKVRHTAAEGAAANVDTCDLSATTTE